MAEITLEYVEKLAGQLSLEDLQMLIDRLKNRLDESDASAGRRPLDLYGAWRGRFPDDIDLDAALYEIRHEWEKEWPEVFRQ
ncbi:MAG: hypothetical protein ACRD9Y_07225 [Blastocatellia bacterium]